MIENQVETLCPGLQVYLVFGLVYNAQKIEEGFMWGGDTTVQGSKPLDKVRTFSVPLS